jgi:hypothetical protein
MQFSAPAFKYKVLKMEKGGGSYVLQKGGQLA